MALLGPEPATDARSSLEARALERAAEEEDRRLLMQLGGRASMVGIAAFFFLGPFPLGTRPTRPLLALGRYRPARSVCGVDVLVFSLAAGASVRRLRLIASEGAEGQRCPRVQMRSP